MKVDQEEKTRFIDHLMGLSFINSDLINNSGSTSTDGFKIWKTIIWVFKFKRYILQKINLNITPKLKKNYGVTHFIQHIQKLVLRELI